MKQKIKIKVNRNLKRSTEILIRELLHRKYELCVQNRGWYYVGRNAKCQAILF